jgi:hypothetical protein
MSEEIPILPVVPPGVREAAQRGVLIPFVGAGISRVAGCPGWEKLADRALQWLIGRGKLDHAQFDQVRSQRPRIKLSLACAIASGSDLQIDFADIIENCNFEEATTGARLYRCLFKLARTFVTTNYDRWLDKGIPRTTLTSDPRGSPQSTGRQGSMNSVHRIDNLTIARLSEPNTVIHLHGSLEDPTSMILTTSGYLDHYASRRPGEVNPVLAFLDFLFANRTVLFMGYGLEDLEILEYVILKAKKAEGASRPEARHYLIQGFFSHEYALMRHLRLYFLQECRIQLIPFLLDEKGWNQWVDVLEEFARVAPVSELPMAERLLGMEALLDDQP